MAYAIEDDDFLSPRRSHLQSLHKRLARRPRHKRVVPSGQNQYLFATQRAEKESGYETTFLPRNGFSDPPLVYGSAVTTFALITFTKLSGKCGGPTVIP